MDLIQIYQCFCDRTRLRILYLLTQGPLCVCHLQEILGEPQVKISKHLAYLRARRMVCAERSGSWVIYSLPVKPRIELESNLRCLQDCVQTDPVFKRDLEALTNLRAKCVAERCSSADFTHPMKTRMAGRYALPLAAILAVTSWFLVGR